MQTTKGQKDLLFISFTDITCHKKKDALAVEGGFERNSKGGAIGRRL
jgi:hypothetical protein